MFKKPEDKKDIKKNSYKTIYEKEKIKAKKHILKNQILKLRLKNKQNEENIKIKIKFKIDHLDSLNNENLKSKIIHFLLQESIPAKLDEYITLLYSKDIYEKHFAIINIRKSIIKDHKICQKIIDKSLLKIFEFASNKNNLHLQLEANWVLTNLCSLCTPRNIINFINKGIIDIFIENLNSEYSQIIEQIVWGLGNLSGDNVNVKFKILKKKNIEFLISVFNKFRKVEKIYDCFIWIFSNLCSLEEEESIFYLKKPFILILIENFIVSENESGLEESLIGIVMNLNKEILELIVNEKFLSKLKLYYSMLINNYYENKNKINSIYEILMKISLDETYEGYLIKYDFLKLFEFGLKIEDLKNENDILMLINNIVFNFAPKIISEKELMKQILNILSSDKKSSINALWIICSMCTNKDKECIFFLIKNINILEMFKKILINEKIEKNVILIILQAMIKLFYYFKETGGIIIFRNQVIENGLAEIIENYQFYLDNDVYVNALFILEFFFDTPVHNPTF